MFDSVDRSYLEKTLELAQSARKPPHELGLPVEPTWAALLATRETEVASAVFTPGDSRDAVRAIFQDTDLNGYNLKDLSLYLSFEPHSTYDRLPPVTESIRALGVKRVVLGAESPYERTRRKGIEALEHHGIRVVLANGEVARHCQMLYEDFGKVMAKSLPALRLVWDLHAGEKEHLEFSVTKKNTFTQVQHDAVLWNDLEMAKKEKSHAWVVVLDPKKAIHSLDEFVAKHVLVFQKGASENKPGFYPLHEVDGHLDLVSVLRCLKDLGILSVICRGDEKLFRLALESRLVDSVLSFLDKEEKPVAVTLSLLSQTLVQGVVGAWHLRLLSPRLLAEAKDSLLVEMGVRVQ